MATIGNPHGKKTEKTASNGNGRTIPAAVAACRAVVNLALLDGEDFPK